LSSLPADAAFAIFAARPAPVRYRQPLHTPRPARHYRERSSRRPSRGQEVGDHNPPPPPAADPPVLLDPVPAGDPVPGGRPAAPVPAVATLREKEVEARERENRDAVNMDNEGDRT
jgi:hypothetical protein